MYTIQNLWASNKSWKIVNDELIEIGNINQYIKAIKKNEVVIIADKSLFINDIKQLLIKLHENDIKNIKLLSSRNGRWSIK